MNKYKWQGETVKVEFGSVIVKPNNENPLYWYNYECLSDGATRNGFLPCVKVITKNSFFLLGNQWGIAEHKLLNGGWPNYSHFSIPNESNFKKSVSFKYGGLIESEYSKHEAERNKWQKENYPKEWQDKQAILEVIRGKKITTKGK